MLMLKQGQFFGNKQSAVTTEIRSPQSEYPEHVHNFQEIVIVSRGQGTHILNDVPTQLSKNYVCYINSKDRHAFEHVNDLYLSNVLYKPDGLLLGSSLKPFLPNEEEKNSGYYISDNALHISDKIINKIKREVDSPGAETDIICQSLFQELVIELWRGKITDIKNLTDSEKIVMAIQMLNSQCDKDLSIQGIADTVKISQRQLASCIKRRTNMSFKQYLNKARVRNAIDLLLYTSDSVTDIAYKVGFSDSNYFSHIFKEITGVTASTYRESIKSNHH